MLRPSELKNLVRLAIREALCACVIFSPPAFGAIELRSLYVQRDFMLILAAVLTLALFHFLRGSGGTSVRIRPIGRRMSDLSQLRETAPQKIHWNGLDELSPNWEIRGITHYPARISGEVQLWSVSLFSVNRVERSSRFPQCRNGFFLLATSPAEAEEILGPMERRVYHRFKDCFVNPKIVHGMPLHTGRPCYVWFPSLEPLQEIMVQFLTMCLAISEDIQLEGSLTLYRGSSFWLEVTWPEIPELAALESQWDPQETMEIVRTGERVGLRLNLTVPEEQLQKLAEPTRREAMAR